MRNLKRALSLALASVMLMGMMVVGSSAAAFTDVDANDNVEAIEVMNALEIMVGDGNGFNPDQKVTRNEMAVVIAKLLGLKAEDFKGTTTFTDVPAWADGFVGACYAEGIIKGYNATTFGGNDGVKAVDAGLMVMKALGYFQFESDFEDDYAMATVKQASKIELFKGIDTAVTATLTRNEVAQLVLNALESIVVEGYQVGSNVNISAGDVSVSVSGTTSYTKETNATNYDLTEANDGYEYLVEKLYGTKVTKDTGVDAYGRPATVWTYTKAATDIKTVTVADEAYAVYVNAFDADVVETLTDAGITLPATATYNKSDVLNVADLYLGKTPVNGYTVELYNTDDNVKTIEKIVVVESNFATVTDVVLTEGKTAGTVELTVSAYPSDVVLTFTDNLKKTDDMYDALCGYAEKTALVVTIDWGNTDKLLAIEEPTAVAGKVTKVVKGAYNTTSTATIGGTEYAMNNLFVNGKNLVAGSEGTLYLDAQGIAIGWTGKTAAEAEYAYVLKAGSQSDAFGTATYYAQLLYVDGTVETVVVSAPATADKLVSYAEGTGANAGKIVLTEKAASYAGTFEIAENNVNLQGAVVNNKTVFVVETTVDSKSVYTVYTGVTNVPALTSERVAGLTKDGAWTVFFAMDSTLATTPNTAKDTVYLVANTDLVKEVISDTKTLEYYVCDAIVNGEITTLKVAATAGLATDLYSALTYDADGLVTAGTAKADNATSKVVMVDETGTAVAKDGVIALGGTNYLYDDATVVYKVANGEVTTSTIGAIKADANDTVMAYTTKGILTMVVITVNA